MNSITPQSSFFHSVTPQPSCKNSVTPQSSFVNSVPPQSSFVNSVIPQSRNKNGNQQTSGFFFAKRTLQWQEQSKGLTSASSPTKFHEKLSNKPNLHNQNNSFHPKTSETATDRSKAVQSHTCQHQSHRCYLHTRQITASTATCTDQREHSSKIPKT